MQETTYFEHDDVKVTNARFVASGETFAIKNITSIKTRSKDPNRLLPIFGILAGLGFVIGGTMPLIATGQVGNGMNLTIGLATGSTLVWFCIRWIRKLRPMLSIILATSGGEKTALKTQQPEYLRQVVAALNNAMAHKD